MRITSKGQVTIPQEIREQAGLLPGTDVDFSIAKDGAVRITRAKNKAKSPSRGQKMVDTLVGKARYGMSADEVVFLMRGESADEEIARLRRTKKK
jgi:AbrB family looped-hinge helix DNA binding protein